MSNDSHDPHHALNGHFVGSLRAAIVDALGLSAFGTQDTQIVAEVRRLKQVEARVAELDAQLAEAAEEVRQAAAQLASR